MENQEPGEVRKREIGTESDGTTGGNKRAGKEIWRKGNNKKRTDLLDLEYGLDYALVYH